MNANDRESYFGTLLHICIMGPFGYEPFSIAEPVGAMCEKGCVGKEKALDVRAVLWVLYFIENTVDDPIGGCCTYAVALAESTALQVVSDIAQDGILHVLRVFDVEMLFTLLVDQMDGQIVEHGEGDLSTVADDENAILAGTLVSHEAPSARGRHTIMELHGSGNGILRRVQSPPIGRISVSLHDRPEELLQEVELMWSQVVEISATGNVRLQSPWKVGLVVVQFARRSCKTDLCRQYISDSSRFYQLLHFLEIGKESAIVCHKAREIVGRRHTVDAYAIVIMSGKRLLNIDRLSCSERHDGIGGMSGGWSSDVDGINVRVGDQVLCIIVPSSNAMAQGKGLGTFQIAAHHRYYLCIWQFGKSRKRATFGSLTATDKSPSDDSGCFHCFWCILVENVVAIVDKMRFYGFVVCKNTDIFVILHRFTAKIIMKDLKHTIKGIVPHAKAWKQQLWRAYLAFAVTAGMAVTSAFAILVPAEGDTRMLDFLLGDGILQVSVSLIVASAIFVVSLSLSVYCSVRAHRRMQKVLSSYRRRELSRQRWNIIVVELTLMLMVALTAFLLPTLILLLSALQATYSGMMLDVVYTPAWAWPAVFIFSVSGMLLLEIVATFCRCCFRELGSEH